MRRASPQVVDPGRCADGGTMRARFVNWYSPLATTCTPGFNLFVTIATQS
jgi:hypothetical protein